MSDDTTRHGTSGRKRRLTSGGIIALVAGVVGLVIVVGWILFAVVFTVQEPEALPTPEDVVSDAPAEERGGSGDGGDLTSVPTQSAPETIEPAESPEETPQE